MKGANNATDKSRRGKTAALKKFWQANLIILGVEKEENMEAAKQKFWVVWGATKGVVRVERYKNKTDAINAAGILCDQIRDSYYVLEAVGIVKYPKLPVIEFLPINQKGGKDEVGSWKEGKDL